MLRRFHNWQAFQHPNVNCSQQVAQNRIANPIFVGTIDRTSKVSATQKFREQVLAILREEFPGKTFTPDPENEGSLKHEGFTLSLANLWSQYQQRLRSEEAQENNEALRSSTKHFIQAILNAPVGIGKRQSWAEAASKLYPFIVNMVTVRNLERNAVCPHFQIGGELALTLVLDFPDCIKYTCWSRT